MFKNYEDIEMGRPWNNWFGEHTPKMWLSTRLLFAFWLRLSSWGRVGWGEGSHHGQPAKAGAFLSRWY